MFHAQSINSLNAKPFISSGYRSVRKDSHLTIYRHEKQNNLSSSMKGRLFRSNTLKPNQIFSMSSAQEKNKPLMVSRNPEFNSKNEAF